MKYILFIICILFQILSYSQLQSTKLKTFKNTQIGIQFNYPDSWELGTPSISNIYWVCVPNFQSGGNIVLKVVPWKYNVDIRGTSKEKYKKDILSTSIYYKDLEFIEYNNNIKISDVDGVFSYYKGYGRYVEKVYYEILVQWWSKNILYTLQGQFEEPELKSNQIVEIKKLIKSIRLN